MTITTQPAAFRVRFVCDPNPEQSLHDPQGDPLPGDRTYYEANPFSELINPEDDPMTGARRPMPWGTYIRTYGDPDNHLVVECLVDKQCPCCGAWQPAGSLCGIDFMNDSPEALAFWHEENYERPLTPQAALTLPGYLAEVARNILTEAGWEAA